MSFRLSPSRPPTVSAGAMICTSQPTATEAGLTVLRQGGNAVDAAITAAAVLCVTEPMSTGVGGDAFALLVKDGEPIGLDAAGPAPAALSPAELPSRYGPTSVTVPGAVAGWAELSRRYGRLGLDRCLAPAIDIAERGFAVAPHCARLWREADPPSPEPGLQRTPAAGEIVRSPRLGATLRRIAELGPDGFYRGPVADAIVAATAIEPDELTGFSPRWTTPLSATYKGMEVLELPAPTQGVAALEALGLLEPMEPTIANQVAAARLALEDAMRVVRDGADVSHLLSAEHLDRRRREMPRDVADVAGGTVYVAAVDEERLAVSFIQSTFHLFGSGVVAGDSGVVLGNRAHCFSITGEAQPGRRPYNTTIPGMLMRDGALVGPFGVMGGFIQAQAHAQFVSAVVDDGLDPQAALDRPRFRVDGRLVRVEPGLELEALDGLRVCVDPSITHFGGGQAIFVEGDALVGGSDARKDGYAGAF